MEKIQVNIFLPRDFVQLIDERAKVSGASRSDIIRRSLEAYLGKEGDMGQKELRGGT